MQAYYETETEISANTRQVTVDLPDNVPPGKIRITVAYEVDNKAGEESIPDEKDRGMAEFLANLPLNTEGGLSIEEIRARVDEERRAWDD